jgi:L-lactate dehydrogenase complex protein LldG
MSSREEILKSIRANKPSSTVELPDTNIKHMSYADKNEKFSEALQSVGGNAIWLEGESIDTFVQKHYQNSNVIVSTCKDITCNTKEQSDITDPHKLENVDLAIIEGKFAVAENGAVWVNEKDIEHRSLYFLATQLLIIVNKENIVDTMHEAYQKVSFDDNGFGVFISGPSKTADIEQSLVIGAHGPTEACVLFV